MNEKTVAVEIPPPIHCTGGGPWGQWRPGATPFLGATAMQRSNGSFYIILTTAALYLPATLMLSHSAGACNPAAECVAPPSKDAPRVLKSDIETGELIDPAGYFQLVVDRYRSLGEYEDTMYVVEVTEQAGREVQRREAEVRCEITDAGELLVRTPAKSLFDELGWKMPLAHSKSMLETRRRMDLWLAPHLGLRYLDNPLLDFREGVEKGFKAKSAKAVKVNDRAMVQIELESDDLENDSNDGADASFDLYIDPESMLVERIEGRQQFDDGSTRQTTLEINPGHVRSDKGEVIRTSRQEAEGVSSPTRGTASDEPVRRGGEDARNPAEGRPASHRPPASK